LPEKTTTIEKSFFEIK